MQTLRQLLSGFRVLPLLILALSFSVVPTWVQALELPESPRDYIYDGAQVFSQRGKNTLFAALNQEDLRSGNQLLVATFPSLEGEDPIDFVNRLFKKWNPGVKGKDNGVILALFVKEHKVRIEVGYGLEPVLTDAITKRVIETALKPRFKNGEFEAGIADGMGTFLSILRNDASASSSAPKNQGPRPRFQFGIFILLGLIFFFLRFLDRTSSFGTRRRGPFYPSGDVGGFSSGGGFGSGSSDDGGFSGGGGSSGGGGASGDW